MYITLLSKESNQFINDIFSSGKSRSTEVSFAVAFAVANKILIPTTKVDNLIEFYNQTNKHQVNGFLNIINETIILDIDAIIELVIGIYQYRYNTIFARENVLAMNTETAIEDLFGISKFINKDTLNIIKADPLLITKYVNNFHKVYCQIVKESQPLPDLVEGE